MTDNLNKILKDIRELLGSWVNDNDPDHDEFIKLLKEHNEALTEELKKPQLEKGTPGE